MPVKVRNLKLLARQRVLAIISLACILCSIGGGLYFSNNANAATNSTINFQARLMNSSGSIAPDGDYNVEFKIYDTVSSGGTAQGVCTGNCKWVETRTGADKIHVANGYLTATLGSVSSFASTINWDQELWITMNIGGTGSPSWDGEMSPRLKLTAVPFAFRASQLVGGTGANTTVLDTGTPSGNSLLHLPAENGTLCVQNSSSCGFVAGTSSNFIQNGTSVQANANYNIRSAASGSVGAVIQGANGQTADLLNLQSWNGTTATTVFGVNNVGALSLNGTGTTLFTTTKASPDQVNTKINIPAYNPGASGQVLALGVPLGSHATSRAIAVFDARDSAHQPSIGVLSPDEENIFGFSWDGSITTGYLKTTAANIGIQTATGDVATFNNTQITLLQDTLLATNKDLTYNTGSGNFDQSDSSGTFETGTGDVSLNGDTEVTGTNTFTVNGGLTTLGAGLTAAGGAIQLNVSSNNTTSINTGTSTGTVSIGNSASGGALTLQSASTIGITTTNFTVTTGGRVTLAGGQAPDITTAVAGGVAGALTLQPGTATGANNGATVTLQGGTAGGSGVKGLIQLNGSTYFTTGTYSSGSTSTITQSLIDSNSAILAAATAGSLTFTVPAPTITNVAGRVLYIINNGANAFTLSFASSSMTLSAGSTATLVWQWNGSTGSWTSAGADVNGVTLQTGYNNSTGSTTPEILLDATRRGIDIQDANSTLGSTEALLSVRASATASTLGNALFVVNGGGKVGINLTSTSTTPTISNDLSFGQIAGASTARTIGVEAQTTAATDGNGLTLQAGTGNTTGAGGQTKLQGGTSGAGAGATGGTVLIQGGTGNGSSSSSGGKVTLQGGTAGTGGVKGLIELNGGTYFTSGTYSSGSTSTITQSLIDSNSSILAAATAGSLTFTVPSPTVTNVAGRVLYITNNGANAFILAGLANSTSFTLNPGGTATLIWQWNGSSGSWTSAGFDAGTLQNAYTNSTGGNTPEILLDSTRNGIDIQDNSLTSGTRLLSVRGTATPTTLGSPLFVVDNTGKVGIGIEQPARTLDVAVNSSAIATPSIRLAQSGTGDATIELRTAGSANSFYLGQDASNSGAFSINSSTVASSFATITHVQSTGVAQDPTSTTISRAFSSNVTAGSLIVASIAWDTTNTTSVTCSDTQGNAFTTLTVYNDTTTHQALTVCYAPNAVGGADTVTATFGATSISRRIIISEYTGVATASPVDVTTGQGGVVGTTGTDAITSGTVNTSISGALVYGAVEDTSGSTTVTAGTGFTQRSTLNGVEMAVQDRTLSPAGTTASTNTFSTNGHRYDAIVVVFRPAETTLTDTFASPLFTMSQSGATRFKNSANSTAAFQVQNASSTTLFGIDTVTPTISVGVTGSTAQASTVNVATSTGATQTINIGSASAGTAANGTTVLVQGGNTSSAVGIQALAGGTISIGTGNVANTIQIGSTSLASSTQTINIGNNNTSGGTTTITIGTGSSATGGTTTLQAKASITIATNGVTRGTFDNTNTVYFGNGVTAAAPNDFTISGTGSATTAVTGGKLTIQGGNATVGNANGGNVTLTGGTGFGTGVRGLVVMDTPTFTTTANDANCYTSGALVTSSCSITASTLNNSSAVLVGFNQTGQTATLPDPTNTTAGRILYVTAANGSSDFTLSVNGGGTGNTIAMRQNTTATMIWNGSDWTAAGASSSTTLQSAYDSTLSSAGGAEIVLNNSATSDGLTVRNNASNPIIGAILEAQTSIGSNLFSVNNNATEYATNGGAETAGASSSTFPSTTWSAAPAGGTVSRNTTATNNATGQASVSVVTAATADHGARDRLSAALTANLQYTVSFTVKGTTSFTTLNTVYSRDGTNTSTTACATGSTVTTAIWTRISCTFTAPSSGITSSNEIFIRQSDATARTFYIDNLSVTVNASANHAADGSVDSALGTNWTAYDADGSTGTTSLSRDTSVIYDTSGSVADVTSAAANEGMRNNMTITPTVSTQYLVTFYARSSNTFTDIRVGFLPAGGSSTPVTAQLCTDYNTQTVSTTGWTKITCIITTPSSGITDPDLVIYQPTATARTFYVDALSITLNTNTASNVQVGGGSKGGPATLFTLDRSAGAPIADNNDAYLGSMYYDTTSGRIQCYEADGWGACGAAPDNIVNLNPEYAGAVLNGTGVGTMTADFCSNDTALQVNTTLCSTGQAKNYYRWTSPQASQQTYSIYVTYQLPATFKNFSSDDTVQLVARTDSTSNAAVTYEMFKSDGSTVTKCGTSETTVVTSANTWQSVGINGNESTSCNFSSSSAGNFVIFKINMKANSNANAYVSTLSFTTTGR